MLRVYIYNGLLETRNPGNLQATLDIAYKKQEAWADYALAMSRKGVGEVLPDVIEGYPRWADSMWDLVARALSRILFRTESPDAAENNIRLHQIHEYLPHIIPLSMKKAAGFC